MSPARIDSREAQFKARAEEAFQKQLREYAEDASRICRAYYSAKVNWNGLPRCCRGCEGIPTSACRVYIPLEIMSVTGVSR